MQNGGISRGREDLHDHVARRRAVEHPPARAVTAADVVRGVKRTCNPVQPFGGIPDFADLIVGYQDFCDGFGKVRADGVGHREVHGQDTDLPGVTAKDDTTVVFTLTHPATYFVDMLTLPAFSPAPEEVLKYVPGSQDLGQHQVSDGPYQIDSWSPTKRSRSPATRPGTPTSDPVRKAYVDKIVVDETVSQESIQQQLETGTPSADMEFDQAPPPSAAARADRAQGPATQPRARPRRATRTSSSTPCRPTTTRRMQDVKVRQALEYAINRDNIIQVLGGPTRQPAADPRAARQHPRLQGLRPLPLRRRQGQAAAAARPATAAD